MGRAIRALVVGLFTVTLVASTSTQAFASTPTESGTAADGTRLTGIDKVVRINGQVRTYLNANGTLQLVGLNLAANELAAALRDSDAPFLKGAGIAPTLIRWIGLNNVTSASIAKAFAASCRRGVMIVQGYLYGPVYVHGTPIGIGYLLVAPRDDGKRC